MLLALHAALVAAAGRRFPAHLAAGALRPLPAVAAVLRRRARARGALGRAAARDHRGDPLVPLRLDDRRRGCCCCSASSAGASSPCTRSAAQPLLPGRLRLPARDAAALGGAGAAARRAADPGDRRAASRAASCRSCSCCSLVLPLPAARTTRRRCSTSSTRCWCSSWAWCWCWARSSLMRFTGDDYFDVGGAHACSGFGVALFVLAVLWNPRARLRRPAHLLLALPAVGGHALRAVDAAHRRARRDRARLAPLPRAGAARRSPRSRGCAAAAGRSPDGEGSFGAARASTRRASATTASSSSFHTERARSRPRSSCTCACSRRWWASSTRASGARARCAQHAYLQAVHETGARLTHDVKNLLQSLYALTSMAPKEPADGYAGLLQRQLPQLTSACTPRSRSCARPRSRRATCRCAARAWWAEVERRLAGSGVALEAAIAADGDDARGASSTASSRTRSTTRAPSARASPASRSRCASRATRDRVELSVCDTGSAVPEAVAARLFREPIERARRARHRPLSTWRARRAGAATALELAANRDGRRVLPLARRAAQARQR